MLMLWAKNKLSRRTVPFRMKILIKQKPSCTIMNQDEVFKASIGKIGSEITVEFPNKNNLSF